MYKKIMPSFLRLAERLPERVKTPASSAILYHELEPSKFLAPASAD